MKAIINVVIKAALKLLLQFVKTIVTGLFNVKAIVKALLRLMSKLC